MTRRAPEDLDRPPVEASPLDPRRVMLICAGLMAVFGGLTLWALQPSPPDGPPGWALPVATDDHSPEASQAGPESPLSRAANPTVMPDLRASPTPAAPPRSDDVPPEEGWLVTPLPVPALLDQYFQHRRSDGSARVASLRHVLRSRRSMITVINVWATYCEPCKREFPGFRRLQEGWGDDVRFVPVQIGDDDPGTLRGLMPLAPDQLVDLVPGGVVQKTLEALVGLPPKAPIPITLVLDCTQHLRWLRTREVKDLAEFDTVVATLRAELGTRRCIPQTPWVPTAPPGPESPKSPPSAEVSADLCKPPCKAPQQCRRRPEDGRHICLHDLEE